MVAQAETRLSPARHAILLVVMAAFAAVVFAKPPIPQDVAYHHLADTRGAFALPTGSMSCPTFHSRG
jgi:hypothetical protein